MMDILFLMVILVNYLVSFEKKTLEWANTSIPISTSWDYFLCRKNEISSLFPQDDHSIYIYNEDL